MARTKTSGKKPAKKKTTGPRKTPIITSGAIRRLCVLAHIKRISQKAVNQMKRIIMIRIDDILKNANTLKEHGRRHTLKVEDLVFLHKMYGTGKGLSDITLCKNIDMLKKKARKGTVGSCIVMMGNVSFGKLIKSVLNKYDKQAIISKHFRLHMQYFIETQAVKLLMAANNAAVEIGKRRTVFLKDINFVEVHKCTASHVSIAPKTLKKKKATKTKKAKRVTMKKKMGKSPVS